MCRVRIQRQRLKESRQTDSKCTGFVHLVSLFQLLKPLSFFQHHYLKRAHTHILCTLKWMRGNSILVTFTGWAFVELRKVECFMCVCLTKKKKEASLCGEFFCMHATVSWIENNTVFKAHTQKVTTFTRFWHQTQFFPRTTTPTVPALDWQQLCKQSHFTVEQERKKTRGTEKTGEKIGEVRGREGEKRMKWQEHLGGAGRRRRKAVMSPCSGTAERRAEKKRKRLKER